MKVWGRAGEGKGAGGEKLHGQGGQGQSSLFRPASPASGMLTHWDLLGGSSVQRSPRDAREGSKSNPG